MATIMRVLFSVAALLTAAIAWEAIAAEHEFKRCDDARSYHYIADPTTRGAVCPPLTP